MKIYIVRHGETDWNSLGLIQGKIDNPLNQKGIDQAVNLIGDYFKDKNIDHVITTSLSRAQKTLYYIMQENNLNTKVDINDNFIERSFGEMEGKHVDEFYACENHNAIKGFESDIEIEKRSILGLEQTTKLDVQNVIIVCHSHIMKAILVSLFNYEYTYKLPNCAIIELDYINGEYQLVKIR